MDGNGGLIIGGLWNSLEPINMKEAWIRFFGQDKSHCKI